MQFPAQRTFKKGRSHLREGDLEMAENGGKTAENMMEKDGRNESSEGPEEEFVLATGAEWKQMEGCEEGHPNFYFQLCCPNKGWPERRL